MRDITPRLPAVRLLSNTLIPTQVLACILAATPIVRGAPTPGADKDVIKLYNAHCGACHGKDGRGADLRAALPKIPDFTSAPWQAERSDIDIGRKIVEGHEPDMPAFKDKLDKGERDALAAFVRTFAQDNKKTKATRSAALAQDAMVAKLYRETGCVNCHGKDGKGGTVKASMPAIPDFTTVVWQKSRSNAQLTASILDGKGTSMPPFREKMKAEEIQGMIGYLRAFAAGEAAAENTAPLSDFEEKFQALEEEFKALKKQHEELRNKARRPCDPR
jgi:mono/diheme cytochrome c family protein